MQRRTFSPQPPHVAPSIPHTALITHHEYTNTQTTIDCTTGKSAIDIASRFNKLHDNMMAKKG
ncbi:hypothetical protein E2C01_076950 [Portunus trituberculatus]|uniref:Uncharacterized protein n=1 Tax=Portunus trituberculatus TaxID=210409 RepID=A0A5B7IEH5_PORTR|nr:hypothetical protein [Portunus trituberculatus]